MVTGYSLALSVMTEARRRKILTGNKQDYYRGADKSLARPRRQHTTATEDFDFHISYL